MGQYLKFEDNRFLDKFEKKLQEFTKLKQPMGIREAIIQEAKEIGLEEGLEQAERTDRLSSID